MKYLKKYESADKRMEVWKVPYKLPYTEIAAEKLDCNLTTYDLYKINKSRKSNKKFIFFVKDSVMKLNFWEEINWSFDFNLSKLKTVAKLTNRELIYNGELEITEEDIKMYYLKKDADKYNL